MLVAMPTSWFRLSHSSAPEGAAHWLARAADSLGMPRTLALVAAATLAGCGIADFDISQDVPEQTIQGSGVPAPIAAVFPLPLSLDIGSKIKQRETGPIYSVTLESLVLEIHTSGASWGFVDSIDVYVESTKQGTSLPKVKLASVKDPPATTTLTFVVEDDVNLKGYIDEGAKVDSSGTGTQPSSDVTFDGKSVFTVHPF